MPQILQSNIIDTCNVAHKAVSQGVGGSGKPIDLWLIVSLVELVIIIFLIFKNIKLRKYDIPDTVKVKRKILNNEIDLGNTINSAFHAKQLYDILKVKCHPDRFIGDEKKHEEAERLSLEISKYKNNLKELERLKKEASELLQITF